MELEAQKPLLAISSGDTPLTQANEEATFLISWLWGNARGIASLMSLTKIKEIAEAFKSAPDLVFLNKVPDWFELVFKHFLIDLLTYLSCPWLLPTQHEEGGLE